MRVNDSSGKPRERRTREDGSNQNPPICEEVVAPPIWNDLPPAIRYLPPNSNRGKSEEWQWTRSEDVLTSSEWGEDWGVPVEETGPEADTEFEFDLLSPEKGDGTEGMDRRELIAHERNMQRIEEARLADETLLGKHLPNDLCDALFPFSWLGPDDHEEPPEDWLRDIEAISKKEVPTPDPPPFHFKVGPDEKRLNAELLKDNQWHLGKVLADARGTTAGPGAEFRPVEDLSVALRHHPNLKFLLTVIREGMRYYFSEELTEEERARELEEQVSRGNHKSALVDPERLKTLLEKDVRHGFCLPLPAEAVRLIKGAMVQPCGMVEQFSIVSDGTRALKRRLTHDLSFSITKENASVNSRIDMEAYPEMVYGWCLNRIIHYTVCLRHRYPGLRIFCQKFDYSDAYRRMAHHWTAAVQTILTLDDTAYLMLRLAFGGAPNPPCFCCFSEALTDLSNELASSTQFDPEDYNVPTVEESHLVPVDHPEPAAQVEDAIKPAFDVPTESTSRNDCFIDDIINIFLDIPSNWPKESFIVPLAVHLLSRPHAGDTMEPVPRRPLLGPDKLAAEGRPAEVQIVLGWLIDFRRLLVALPTDKFLAWRGDLIKVLAEGKLTFGELESLIGRLNHSSFVIPLSRHYLNGVRRRAQQRKHKGQVVRLTADELADLKLWEGFLETAHRGISMNLLTVRLPTIVAWSDSCPFGLGGYLQSGRAWRLKVPPNASFYGDDSVNNVLEFLALAVNVILMIEEVDGTSSFPCLMPLSDNTSGIGWVFKSGRIHPNSKYYGAIRHISRTVAMVTMKANAQLCPQHLPGCKNDVADLLSFAGQARGKTCSSGGFPNLSAVGRSVLSRLNHDANSRIVLGAKTEAAHEKGDRTWRRWRGFLDLIGLHDPLLDGVPPEGRAIICKGFVMALRTAKFDRKGRITGRNKRKMASASIRDAASLLGEAFRKRDRASPMHVTNPQIGRPSLIPPIRDLLKALEKEDPPPHRQAAATPELLRKAQRLAEGESEEDKHIADLIIGAYFFAMRACEFCRTPVKGKTKMLTLKHVTFRTKRRKVISHNDPDLLRRAHYVTVCFVDQKNGKRMDRRTQGRSRHRHLCPVEAWARVVLRVRDTSGSVSPDTPVCQLYTGLPDETKVTAEQIAAALKAACAAYGGKKRFGFGPDDLGTRSIRSGAAMALFLNDHSVEKIKILGRWSSDAFLVYIRPQVLEWTSLMAEDMARTRNFLDLTFCRGGSKATDREGWHTIGMMPSFANPAKYGRSI